MAKLSVSAMIAFARECGDEAPAAAIDLAAQRAAPPLVLVACCAGKQARRAPARDLYTSDLFKRSRAYAEALGGDWRILSARHHLLRPEQVIAPYDDRLDARPPRDRRLWAIITANAVRLEGGAGRRIVMLAGEAYRAELAPMLEDLGCVVEVPMRGLGIGHQRQWLARAVEELR